MNRNASLRSRSARRPLNLSCLSTWIVLAAATIIFSTACSQKGSSIPGGGGEIRGRVVDAFGEGIEASISVSPDPDPRTDEGYGSDTTGEFSVSAPRGVYVLSIRAVGFESVEKEVRLFEDLFIVNIELVKS